MSKKYPLKSISLGSEPDLPVISDLKDLISRHRGIEADLITFQMYRSYSAQKDAKIDEMGVGGRYLRPRIEKALSWDEEMGPLVEFNEIVRDYSMLTKHEMSIRSVHESPSVLSSSPAPENEDAFAEICHSFNHLLRTLRDNRITGHVIHLIRPLALEIELLVGPKNVLYIHDPTSDMLEEFLEYSRDLILPADKISLMDSLIDQYQIRTITLCNASEHDISGMMQYVDSDHLKVAGYCIGPEDECWKKIKGSAVISL